MVELATPVDMTIFMDDVPPGEAGVAVNTGTPAGDCLRACVASLLGQKLTAVPHFAQYIEHPHGTDPLLWWWSLVGYCSASGRRVTWSDDVDAPPAGWSIVSGTSVRGHRHVCIAYDGEVVFDPHPSRAGLAEIDGWIIVESER